MLMKIIVHFPNQLDSPRVNIESSCFGIRVSQAEIIYRDNLQGLQPALPAGTTLVVFR
jgi:hypothetical protein